MRLTPSTHSQSFGAIVSNCPPTPTPARLGHSLEASRQVRRFAYDGLLLGGTLAYKVTHHDQPGRNPDPDLQRHAGGRVEFRYGFDQSKSSFTARSAFKSYNARVMPRECAGAVQRRGISRQLQRSLPCD
jgi:hypothetical protein